MQNGMDDMMLDSVIIPALDNVSVPGGLIYGDHKIPLFTLTVSCQLSLRVPNNEARHALHALRLAFEDAERHVPGVCVALVAEIVESVEQVDEDAD